MWHFKSTSVKVIELFIKSTMKLDNLYKSVCHNVCIFYWKIKTIKIHRKAEGTWHPEQFTNWKKNILSTSCLVSKNSSLWFQQFKAKMPGWRHRFRLHYWTLKLISCNSLDIWLVCMIIIHFWTLPVAKCSNCFGQTLWSCPLFHYPTAINLIARLKKAALDAS